MESLTATRDPVLQGAARIAGFAEAMVQDTDGGGRVVLCRHRFGGWTPFGHLEPGETPLNAFYGTAFWERDDVLAMYGAQEERKAASLASTEGDIRKDFRKEVARLTSRVDGKADLIAALAKLNAVRT
jgi:hypothetical protein